MRVMQYASSHWSFSKIFFDVYNFSIISNLFDSDKSYNSDRPCHEEVRYTSIPVFLFHTPYS